MSYRNKTYVIFDGDNDMWEYGFMIGWNSQDHMDFDFDNAYAISLIRSGSSEETVKRHLRERFSSSSQVIVLIGEHTKNLYKYVRWEIEIAQNLGLPIIGVNLNNKKICDDNLCPSILKNYYTVYVPFKMKIIKYALDNFPSEFRQRSPSDGHIRTYGEQVYKNLGL